MLKRDNYNGEKLVSGCSISGVMNEDGKVMSGGSIIHSIAVMHDRSNGLGGGFAAYGIYPDYKEYYAFHLMFDDLRSKEETEYLLNRSFVIKLSEEMPTKPADTIHNPPLLHRYFIRADKDRLSESELTEDDFVVRAVMKINTSIEGAYVMSSGKDMGAFKAVGYPEDVGRFYRLEEYKGHTWISHGRFPTNTPGWWAGAHPFTILDWAIVHNGEISSYGANRRYLEMYGYKCTMMTDTEVAAYLFDLLLRRHKLPVEIACKALASPFWSEIDRLPEEERELISAVRQVYGSALLNGPFSILLGFNGGMVGLNDRIKLRPMVAARKGSLLYMSSEECGIREICPRPEVVWAPKAGEPVIGRLKRSGQKIRLRSRVFKSNGWKGYLAR